MTVYNTKEYLREAVDSILHQTFDDFELIIIDDASNDGSAQILDDYKDKRVKVVHNSVNIGAAGSSNIGLKMASGKYIARIDSDDISLPNRLEKQYQYMEEKPELAVLGSWTKVFGDQNCIWIYPSSNEEIRSSFLFNPCLVHSTIMMRKSVLDKYDIKYNANFSSAIDYELYSQFPDNYLFENLPEVLGLYRKHSLQMSNVHRKTQQKFADVVRAKYLNKLHITTTDDEQKLHSAISLKDFPLKLPERLQQSAKWLSMLRQQNNIFKVFDIPSFEKKLAEYMYAVSESYSCVDTDSWSQFFKLDFSSALELPENKIDLNKLRYILGDMEKNIVIFGTNRMGYFFSEQLKNYGYQVTCFIDNNEKKAGKKLNGIQIMKPEMILDATGIDAVLITILGEHDKEIMEQLKKMYGEQLDIVSWKQFL